MRFTSQCKDDTIEVEGEVDIDINTGGITVGGEGTIEGIDPIRDIIGDIGDIIIDVADIIWGDRPPSPSPEPAPSPEPDPAPSPEPDPSPEPEPGDADADGDKKESLSSVASVGFDRGELVIKLAKSPASVLVTVKKPVTRVIHGKKVEIAAGKYRSKDNALRIKI